MQPKKIRLLLITGVVAVWGLIIYRVITGLRADDQLLPTAARPLPDAAANIRLDTFLLIDDYPDPFLPQTDTAPGPVAGEIKPPTPIAAQAAAASPGYVAGTIQYIGMIANAAKKLKIASITIQGKELLVKEQENVDGYTIRSIDRDRIVVLYHGQSIPIRRNK